MRKLNYFNLLRKLTRSNIALGIFMYKSITPYSYFNSNCIRQYEPVWLERRLKLCRFIASLLSSRNEDKKSSWHIFVGGVWYDWKIAAFLCSHPRPISESGFFPFVLTPKTPLWHPWRYDHGGMSTSSSTTVRSILSIFSSAAAAAFWNMPRKKVFSHLRWP